VTFEVARIERRYLSVEIAGLRVWVCPGSVLIDLLLRPTSPIPTATSSRLLVLVQATAGLPIRMRPLTDPRRSSGSRQPFDCARESVPICSRLNVAAGLHLGIDCCNHSVSRLATRRLPGVLGKQESLILLECRS